MSLRDDQLATLKAAGKDFDYYNIANLDGIDHLPYSLKVLVENLVRNIDGANITDEHVKTLLDWDPNAEPSHEIQFTPSRVIMQDFTGVPCIVDLATMRDAVKDLGGDPEVINPQVQSDMVIDHSVQIDKYGVADAVQQNMDIEYQRNGERYQFLRWGQQAFRNFRVVPPGTGIIHQVNIEYLAKVVMSKAEANGNPIEAFKAIAQNDQLLWVALSYLLYSVANVATTGVLFYQFKYVLGAPDSFSIAGIIPVITGLGTTPLYPVLNRRIPRRWLYTAGMALMIAGYTLFIIAPMNLPVVIVALVLFYLPAQTIQMTAILSMTDSIEYGQLKTGKRNEAVTLSVRPMLDKIAGALSNGIVGFVVVAAGMVGNATAADMTAANIRTFKTCAYYLPLAGIVASLVVFLLTVKIDENMHAHIVEQLEGRLASEEADKQ